jgi:hypothetical protein
MGTNILELSPNNSAIGGEDALDKWRAVMSAICTGCMNLVTETRQKNLSRLERDFLPVGRSLTDDGCG